MKILVDKMPIQVEDCPYSNPTDIPWNDRTIEIFWGTKLKWYQALWLDLIFYWKKGVNYVFKR